MGFFDFVMFASFVIALVVGPFVVGSCNPALWVFYLSLCTMLTPLLGIPIYKAIFTHYHKPALFPHWQKQKTFRLYDLHGDA